MKKILSTGTLPDLQGAVEQKLNEMYVREVRDKEMVDFNEESRNLTAVRGIRVDARELRIVYKSYKEKKMIGARKKKPVQLKLYE